MDISKVKVRRVKTCGKKVSFTNLNAAKRVAAKYDQSVYECPICFCFHCTSKEDWTQEFVSVEKYNNVYAEMQRRDATIKKQKKTIQAMHNMLKSKDGQIKNLKEKLRSC